jgi:hypothetical protein
LILNLVLEIASQVYRKPEIAHFVLVSELGSLVSDEFGVMLVEKLQIAVVADDFSHSGQLEVGD